MVFERTKLIRFHQCDPAGIVFYPQYLILCNELVEDWFAQGIGVSFFELHATLRRGLPMRSMQAEFIAPSIHGDELIFQLRVVAVGNTSVSLRITAEKDGVVRFTAEQTAVWIDLDRMRPIRIDDSWREKIQRYMDRPELPVPSRAAVKRITPVKAVGSKRNDACLATLV